MSKICQIYLHETNTNPFTILSVISLTNFYHSSTYISGLAHLGYYLIMAPTLAIAPWMKIDTQPHCVHVSRLPDCADQMYWLIEYSLTSCEHASGYRRRPSSTTWDGLFVALSPKAQHGWGKGNVIWWILSLLHFEGWQWEINIAQWPVFTFRHQLVGKYAKPCCS